MFVLALSTLQLVSVQRIRDEYLRYRQICSVFGGRRGFSPSTAVLHSYLPRFGRGAWSHSLQFAARLLPEMDAVSKIQVCLLDRVLI
jgi:hypothetical protein